jgi:hypothetical protein
MKIEKSYERKIVEYFEFELDKNIEGREIAHKTVSQYL